MPDSSAAGTEPGHRLASARRALVDTLVEPPGVPPREIHARGPIAGVPADVAARAKARADAGLSPFGTRSPRGAVLTRVVVPSAVLAVLDAALVIVGLAAGNGTLTTVAVVFLVIFAAVALLGRRYVAQDPLRLPARDRVAVAKASRWRSSQNWSGRTGTRECTLVAAAADAGHRIASSRAWTSGELARGGVVLALAAELDQVDRATTTELSSDDWERLVTRVAALTAYADTVQHLDTELRQDDVERLAFYLSGAIYDVV